MNPLLIGLDVGTSTIKAVALDAETGRHAASAALPTPVIHPQADASEHDPEVLWQTVAACLRQVTGQVERNSIKGLAISCFGDTGLPIDGNGHPLYPILAWHDRRCAAQVAWLEDQITPEELQEETGQRFSTSLDAPKWLWICDHYPQLAKQTATWMPVASFVLWKLTGEKLTDYSIASRTSLFRQKSHAWSSRMLDLVGLTPAQLPTPLPGGSPAG
ncbi:MAG: FGGY family carbohydrate kinase, partial [Anaerolineaceae bacterium]|nr:FGGY family carbohydrate kinase [Anaerolineaceae bacterium]